MLGALGLKASEPFTDSLREPETSPHNFPLLIWL